MKNYKIEQLSVFIENRPGELAAITALLEKTGISLLSITLSDSSEFAILRLLSTEIELAKKVLLEKGFIAKSSFVFGVQIKDKVGSFHHVVKTLQKEKIDILYTYTVNEKEDGIFIFKIDDNSFDKAITALKNANISLVTQDLLNHRK